MSGIRAAPGDRTIIQLNIDHFRRLLATPLEETVRLTVEQLLAEAEADLAGANQAKAERS